MIFLLILHFIHSWSILSCTKVSFCCSEIKKSQTNFMWNTLAGIKHCDALNCFISVDSLNEKNCCWETFKTVDSLRKGAAGDLRLFCWVWLTFRWKRVLRYVLTVTVVPNLQPQSSNLEYAVWIFHTRYDLYILSFCIFRRSSEVCAGLLSLFIYIEMIHLCLLNVEFTAHFTHTSSGVKRKRRKRGGGAWIKTIPS